MDHEDRALRFNTDPPNEISERTSAEVSEYSGLTTFHHPSLALPGLHPSVHRIPENFNAIGRTTLCRSPLGVFLSFPAGTGIWPAAGSGGLLTLQWQQAVVDFKCQCGEGCGIEASAVSAPEICGVPGAGEGAGTELL